MDNLISKTSPLKAHHLIEGAAILIDKPIEWTSFDVVNKLRFALKHHLHVKKYKVGHAGTLDPLASGLLIICFGKYTKLIESVVAKEKAYKATIALGAETPTLDKEMPPVIYYPYKLITDNDIAKLEKEFIGRISQIPPMYSAIKIKGTPLYRLARRGEEIERKPRNIEIFDIHIEKENSSSLLLDVTCSKGTYIRTLAYDIGKKLHTGAYLSSLKRTRIGDFSVEHSITIQEFIDQLKALDLKVN